MNTTAKKARLNEYITNFLTDSAYTGWTVQNIIKADTFSDIVYSKKMNGKDIYICFNGAKVSDGGVFGTPFKLFFAVQQADSDDYPTELINISEDFIDTVSYHIDTHEVICTDYTIDKHADNIIYIEFELNYY